MVVSQSITMILTSKTTKNKRLLVAPWQSNHYLLHNTCIIWHFSSLDAHISTRFASIPSSLTLRLSSSCPRLRDRGGDAHRPEWRASNKPSLLSAGWPHTPNWRSPSDSCDTLWLVAARRSLDFSFLDEWWRWRRRLFRLVEIFRVGAPGGRIRLLKWWILFIWTFLKWLSSFPLSLQFLILSLSL